MSVTAAEVLILLNGEETAELRERFLREADDSASELNQMLAAAATWARTKLNPGAPAASLAPRTSPPSKVPFRDLRMAGFWDESHPQPKMTDLVDYIQGTASPETTAVIRRALDDPASELSQLLNRLKEQGK